MDDFGIPEKEILAEESKEIAKIIEDEKWYLAEDLKRPVEPGDPILISRLVAIIKKIGKDLRIRAAGRILARYNKEQK